MGKVEDNKKLKMNTLLQTAFDLFTGKGFAKTTVSDIVNQAGLAKGTFYLYFKDKYDLRDKLIAFKASQLFDDAHKALDAAVIPDFEEEILFVTDYIIERFQNQQGLFPRTFRGEYFRMRSEPDRWFPRSFTTTISIPYSGIT